MDKRDLIGKKVLGVKFEDRSGCNYIPEMDDYIGVAGTVVEYEAEGDKYVVQFYNDRDLIYSYPAELLSEYVKPVDDVTTNSCKETVCKETPRELKLEVEENGVDPWVTFKEKEVISSQPNFKKITDSLASLLEYKNKNYGNSALEPLQIFGGKCKVGTRLDDKLARIKNSSVLKKNDVADLIGYAVLICEENNWDNFDEFKD